MVLGAVHGNEKCGARALQDLMRKMEEGKVSLERGKLSIIPICNPAAYDLDKRFTEENLNRVFCRVDQAQSYEQQIAQLILDEIDSADFLLDLHAFSGKGEPFSIVETDCEASLQFAKKLPSERVLMGFTETYSASKMICGNTSIRYAHSKGKPAVTLECGNKSDPRSDDFARRALRSALEGLELISPTAPQKILNEPSVFRFLSFYLKEGEGALAKNFEEGEPVQKGDLLASYRSGEEIRSPRDALVYFACADALIGTEWIYLVEPVSL